MLKTGASANAPVFCVRNVLTSANEGTTHSAKRHKSSINQGITQCVSNKNLS